MRKLFILALAAAAAVGCTKDEVLDFNKEAIGFQNAFINNATRAIDNSFSNDNLPKEFYVYGTTQNVASGFGVVPIFPDVLVSYTNSTWGYAQEHTQYWIDGNTYNFAAVVNGTIDEDKTISYTADYTDIEGTADLLYAKDNYGVYTKGTSETTVSFTFSHLLSKVHFTMKNDIATNVEGNVYTYTVEDIQITNAYSKGVYDITQFGVADADAWAEDDTASKVPVKFGHIADVEGEDAANNTDAAEHIGTWKDGAAVKGIAKATSRYSQLLIPGEYTAMNIKCTITTYLNGEKVDVENYDKNIEITLKEGQAYNFQISKGNPGEQIKFSVSAVNGWGNGNDDDTDGDNDAVIVK